MAEDPARTPEAIRADALGEVPHGFMSRRGGVSIGVVAGLNCGLGSGDDPAAIAENRSRVVTAVSPGASLVGVYQVHSATCVTAREAWDDGARPEADAIVTACPDLLLGILTADCAPVLLADRQAGVIGAAHAGWKGALGGICERTIEAMERLGAAAHRIVAAIGPCIARNSYEVDSGFQQRFANADSANARFFNKGAPGHFQFDLEAYVASRLKAAGAAEVQPLGLDTYAAPDRFYSFRRATHCGEPSYGRQLSVIGLDRLT